MAQRNRQQRNRPDYMERNRENYGRGQYSRDDRDRYYEEGVGLQNLGHPDDPWWHEHGQRSRGEYDRGRQDYPRGREDFGRNIDQDRMSTTYPSLALRGLRDRYDSAPKFFDRFDYDDRTANSSSFIGRGPRGYRRSDDRIREDVCEVLTFDPFVDASEIDIVVLDGNVTLSGDVDDRSQKRRAEDAAENVSGVRDVTNNVRVKSGETGTSNRQEQQTTQQIGRETKRAA